MKWFYWKISILDDARRETHECLIIINCPQLGKIRLNQDQSGSFRSNLGQFIFLNIITTLGFCNVAKGCENKYFDHHWCPILDYIFFLKLRIYFNCCMQHCECLMWISNNLINHPELGQVFTICERNIICHSNSYCTAAKLRGYGLPNVESKRFLKKMLLSYKS